jgi:hypothetical protein
MTLVGVAIALLLLLAVGLLAVPVGIEVDAEKRRSPAVRWRVSWFFGLVTVAPTRRTAGRSGARRRPERDSEKRRRRLTTRRSRGPSARRVLAACRTPGFLARLARLLPDLVRAVRWERAAVELEFGLDDPSDTGTVYGVLVPVLLLAESRGYAVCCRPRFDEACLEGSASLAVRITPLRLVATVLAFVFSGPTLRAAYAVARPGP